MKHQLLLAAFLVALTSQLASAEESNYYIGAGIGRAIVDFNSSDFRALVTAAENSKATSDTEYSIFGGYTFTENWAIEVGYLNLGQFENRWHASNQGLYNQNIYTFDYQADAWFAAVKAALPVTGRLGVFGKLGATINKASDTFTLDRSRHIEVPLPPCFLGNCYYLLPFSDSPIFSKPGDYTTTHVNALIGVGVEYRAFELTSIRFEYEEFGEFGNQDNVGRAKLSLWSLGITYQF